MARASRFPLRVWQACTIMSPPCQCAPCVRPGTQHIFFQKKRVQVFRPIRFVFAIRYNCPLGTVQPNPCAPGTYSLAGNTGTCIPCLSGNYCPLALAFEFGIPCPNGTYNGVTGKSALSDCTTCEPGYYCPQIIDPTLTFTGGGTGWGDRPVRGAVAHLPCPAGTVNPFSGNGTLAACTTTPVGYYTASAAFVIVACAAGFYQPLTGQSVITSCITTPMGFYNLIGSPLPVPCPAGYYQPFTQQVSSAACIICPTGYYCPQNATWVCKTFYVCKICDVCEAYVTCDVI